MAGAVAEVGDTEKVGALTKGIAGDFRDGKVIASRPWSHFRIGLVTGSQWEDQLASRED